MAGRDSGYYYDSVTAGRTGTVAPTFVLLGGGMLGVQGIHRSHRISQSEDLQQVASRIDLAVLALGLLLVVGQAARWHVPTSVEPDRIEVGDHSVEGWFLGLAVQPAR